VAVLIKRPGNPQLPIQAQPDALPFPAWYQGLRASLWRKLRSVASLPDGYRLYFQGEEEIRAFSDKEKEDKTGDELKAFVELEALRLPFLSLELRNEGPAFVLVLTGPPGTPEWLKEEFELV
jgi:hypothetical protein